nr:immunoglobulin heavy chain junction region [Mus musculus]
CARSGYYYGSSTWFAYW